MSFFQNIQQNLPIILLVVVLVIIQYFFRRRRGPIPNQAITVQNLLSETRINQKIVDYYSFDFNTRRFITTTYRIYKRKLDFLGSPLRENVIEAYDLAEDYNQQIKAAKKNKSTSYMSNIDVAKLKKMMARCQEGLEQWLVTKVGSKNPPLNTGIFDNLFGK